jgi:magnesium-transporting ATPase (P-type)
MKKTFSWLAALALIAAANAFPQFQPVLMATAWIIIALVLVMVPVISAGFILAPDDKKIAAYIQESAKKYKPRGCFGWFRLIALCAALAYTGLAVTAVFWFFAGCIANIPGKVAQSVIEK